MWGGRVFVSKREFAAWLEQRDRSYAQWLKQHPGSAPWEPAPAKAPARPAPPDSTAAGEDNGRSVAWLAGVAAALAAGLVLLIRLAHGVAWRLKNAIERLSPRPGSALFAAPAGHPALAFVRPDQEHAESSPGTVARVGVWVGDEAPEPARPQLVHTVELHEPPLLPPPGSPPPAKSGRAKVASTPRPANDRVPSPVSHGQPEREPAPPPPAAPAVPVDAGGSAVEPAGRAESDTPEAAAQLPVDEITCEIAYWRGYVRSKFYARLVAGDDGAIATSPLMRSHSPVPEQTEECLEAYNVLVNGLLEDGWVPSGQGADWFSARFARRVS